MISGIPLILGRGTRMSDPYVHVVLGSEYPQAPCSCIVDTRAVKWLPSHNFWSYVYAIQLHGAFGIGVQLLEFGIGKNDDPWPSPRFEEPCISAWLMGSVISPRIRRWLYVSQLFNLISALPSIPSSTETIIFVGYL